ncbi:MAG: alanine racemase [Alphaproteobacteria bacterium]|nr:alanine racemase [Alphaproteobacteria bacterium]
MPSYAQAGAILSIDLAALVDNWRRLGSGAAVVKANAYGLGIEPVARALATAGCRTFFVAHIHEALILRQWLAEPTIFVLHGPPPGTEPEFTAARLIPVLSTLDQVAAWRAHAAGQNLGLLDAALQLDTGMTRLGLSPADIETLGSEPWRLEGVRLVLVMSHLACADDPTHVMNEAQYRAFATARDCLPPAPASLAASSGIFLGPQWWFDMVRPGAALYGVNPTPGEPNPMAQVVRLQGKIIQVRNVDSPQTVGYGATHRVAGRGRVATVAVGYADGYPRSLSNRGSGFLGTVRVPLVGRVSMDLVTFDVSAVPETLARPGGMIDLIGPLNPVDAVAALAGTIGYEILTSLGQRYHRRYNFEAG